MGVRMQGLAALAALAALLSPYAASAAEGSDCHVDADGSCAAPVHSSSMMQRTHKSYRKATVLGREDAEVHAQVPMRSRDVIYLRAPASGTQINLEASGEVHARADTAGSWERSHRLGVFKVNGDGEVQSGDSVYFLSVYGKPITVLSDGGVLTDSCRVGELQEFTIEKKDGPGTVHFGDTVFLSAKAGYLSVLEESGAVRAQGSEKGFQQELVVEKLRQPTPTPRQCSN